MNDLAPPDYSSAFAVRDITVSSLRKAMILDECERLSTIWPQGDDHEIVLYHSELLCGSECTQWNVSVQFLDIGPINYRSSNSLFTIGFASGIVCGSEWGCV